MQERGGERVERLARWTRDTAADGRLEGSFGLDLVADSSGLATVGGQVTAIGGVRLQQLYAAFQPSPGAVQMDTLVVRSNAMTLDGGGRIALRSGPSAANGSSGSWPGVKPCRSR